MTAMDEHFADEESQGSAIETNDEATVAPAKKESFLKQNAHLIVGAVVLAIGGATIYNRNFGGQDAAPASVAGLEAIGQQAPEPTPLVVNTPVAPSAASAAPEVEMGGRISGAQNAPESMQAQAVQAPPVAPVAQHQLTNPAAAPAPTPAPPPTQAPVAPVAAVQQPDSQEIAGLKKALAAAKAHSAGLEAQIRALQEKLRQQQAAAPVAPRQPVAPKPATKPAPAQASTQAAESSKPVTRAAAAPGVASSAPSTVTPVPSRYRVYAMRENMAWIQDSQTRETIPAPVGATLPDGSRVVSLDESSGVVQTTSGAIRYGSGRGN